MSEFIDYLSEVFAGFGPVRARRMFGGHGIYHNDIMFALVADDVLYLKADGTTEKDFISRGLQAFEYVKKGKPIKLSYFQAPEEIYEDSEMAAVWARKAYAVATGTKSS